MRLKETAELQIYCPRCGNKVNEYNWTLETASKFSVNGKTTPTLIYILLRLTENDQQWNNFRVICPRCHETMPLKIIPIPEPEELLAYVKEVGEDYVNSCF